MIINRLGIKNKFGVKVIGLVVFIPLSASLVSLTFPFGLILNLICIATSVYGAYLAVRYEIKKLAVFAIVMAILNFISFAFLSIPSFLVGVFRLLYMFSVSFTRS